MGNFQMYVLQWTAGSLADPDILRRVFHSKQVPPEGFNRGHFSDPRVDALLDEAASSTDEAHRLDLFQQVQRLVAIELPYISLWNKTNFIIAQGSLAGRSDVSQGCLADPVASLNSQASTLNWILNWP